MKARTSSTSPRISRRTPNKVAVTRIEGPGKASTMTPTPIVSRPTTSPPFPQPLRYRSIHDGPRFIEDHGFDASVVSTDSSIIDLVTAGVDIAADNTTYRLM